MDLLCEVCDRSIIENKSDNDNYLTTLRKKIDKSLYNNFTINNYDLDEVIKTLNNYISTHNKIFEFYFINCEFVIEIDNKFTANIKNICFCNTDFVNINLYFLYYIECYESRGHKFYNINQMTIKKK